MSSVKKEAVFAGGCFWGLEELFRREPGVISTEVGYTGGTNDHPTYEHHPGHAEALKIEYDPMVTSYHNLLDFFFRVHDPTTKNRQGNDIGTSYRSAIFYANAEERFEAERFIAVVNRSGAWSDPVVTTLEPLATFWAAEDYHQDYLQKHPHGYTCHQVYFDEAYDVDTIALSQQRCIPCEGGVLPLGREEAGFLLATLSGWKLGAGCITKKYTFANFHGAVAFVNRVAELAETEGHHPDISIQYRKVTLTHTTHAIGGLSINDFILAAKIDGIDGR